MSALMAASIARSVFDLPGCGFSGPPRGAGAVARGPGGAGLAGLSGFLVRWLALTWQRPAVGVVAARRPLLTWCWHVAPGWTVVCGVGWFAMAAGLLPEVVDLE